MQVGASFKCRSGDRSAAVLFCLLFAMLGSVLINIPHSLSKTSTEPRPDLPGATVLRSLPKSSVNKQFVDGLKDAANFQDYEVMCRLFTRKSDDWKDFGSANIFFKQKQLFRAVIGSSDYRNGSVVVKEADGAIRGRGGGSLTFVKMTLQPDSRTIKLPTGYSLVESDFVSLYRAVQSSMAKGSSAFASQPVSLKPFKDPVMVLLLTSGSQADSPISEVVFLDPRTKLPLVWNTYKDGEPHAIVMFEDLKANKGLSDELFHL